MILHFIPKSSILQAEETILITSRMPIYSLCKLRLMPTGNIIIRKWRNKTLNLRSSRQRSKIWWIRFKFRIPHQKIWINQSIRILPLLSQLTIGPHHWKVDILQKIMACGLSNMRPDKKDSMNSSWRHNSNMTLIWNSRTSTTTSRFVSMRLLDSKKNFFPLTIPSKYNLSSKTTLSQIVITLTMIGMNKYTIPLDTDCCWYWIMTPLKKFHGTSGLQGCKHPCSWNLRMNISI